MIIESRCGRYRARVAPSPSPTRSVRITLLERARKGRVVDKQWVYAWRVINRVEYDVPWHVALDLAHDLVASIKPEVPERHGGDERQPPHDQC